MVAMTERTPDTDTPGQAPDTRRPTRAVSPRAVSGKAAGYLGGAFYTVVLATAWAGQTLAAVTWLDVPWPIAALAVSALELGGVALAARADFRRRLNETAVGARLLSAAVAGFAVAFNWLGHADHLQGAFFAGMSALGYGVWLINAGDRRRDQLRTEGKLPPPPPSYERWQWIQHPLVTWRARGMAKADPSLGTYGSLTAARQQIRVERRTRAIARVLNRKVADAAGPRIADIAVNVYDLDEIAVRLAGTADYDGLTALIAADLTPDRLTEPAPDTAATETADTTEPAADTGENVVDLRTAGQRRQRRTDSQSNGASATGQTPTVQQLADTLTAKHGSEYVGLPTALKTLKAKYGTCAKDRAIKAKEIHNGRLEQRETQTSGGESADDPKERHDELVHAG